MSLERNETARRFMEALLHAGEPQEIAKTVEIAVGCTDALLAALAPATGPDQPKAGHEPEGREPRRTVGAVTHPKHDSALWIIINGDETDCCRRLDGPNSGRLGDFFRDDVFVRWATREECERHGLNYVARPLPGAPLAAPSPAATPAAWVPSVGDVVGIDGGKDYGETRVVTKIDGSAVSYVRLNTSGGVICGHTTDVSLLTFLRRATSSERAAAGLPVDEAPAFDEAKEREAARVAWATDTELSESRSDNYIAGWIARARVAAKGGVA